MKNLIFSLILTSLFLTGAYGASTNPDSLLVYAEKEKILAGGKENLTDATKLTIIYYSSSTATVTATIAIEGALGTQFTGIKMVNGEAIEIGGDHPARLVGNGITVIAGKNTAQFTLTSNINYVFNFYSSNLVGDSGRVKVTVSGRDYYSQTINFEKPNYKFIYTNWKNQDVAEGETIWPYQLYQVRSAVTYNGIPVTLHRAHLLCESVLSKSGDLYELDADGETNVTLAESDSMAKRVEVQGLTSVILGPDGVIRREKY